MLFDVGTHHHGPLYEKVAKLRARRSHCLLKYEHANTVPNKSRMGEKKRGKLSPPFILHVRMQSYGGVGGRIRKFRWNDQDRAAGHFLNSLKVFDQVPGKHADVDNAGQHDRPQRGETDLATPHRPSARPVVSEIPGATHLHRHLKR